MNLPTLHDIEDSAQVVYRAFAATPQYAWPLLAEKLGTPCWLAGRHVPTACAAPSLCRTVIRWRKMPPCAHMVPSFHMDLLRGVSTAWWELFKAVPALDVVYVPIGLGCSLCRRDAGANPVGRPDRRPGTQRGQCGQCKLRQRTPESIALLSNATGARGQKYANSPQLSHP